MNKSAIKKGMTLIETLVVTALALMLITLIVNLMITSLRTYRVNQRSISMEEKIASVMREFEFSTRAASELISAEQSSLTYYRYYDLTSVSPTQVRYFMAGNEFKVGRTEPVGEPPNVTYPLENEKIVLLIDGVTNITTLFNYFDSNGNLMSLPPDLTQLKMIELNITLRDSITNPPKEVNGSTKVNLRNMKINL